MKGDRRGDINAQYNANNNKEGGTEVVDRLKSVWDKHLDKPRIIQKRRQNKTNQQTNAQNSFFKRNGSRRES